MGISSGQNLECSIGSIRCGNLPPSSFVAYLPNEKVAVYGGETKERFYELLPTSHTLSDCTYVGRYKAVVKKSSE